MKRTEAQKRCNCGCGRIWTSTEERFWSHVTRSDTCWTWFSNHDRYGYGRMTIKGMSTLVHRYSYELFYGKIPKNKVVDHLCNNRMCVRPDHLRVCTNIENILRGQGYAAVNARKTECVNGHKLVGKNLYVQPSTQKRYCRECARFRNRKLYKKTTKDKQAK